MAYPQIARNWVHPKMVYSPTRWPATIAKVSGFVVGFFELVWPKRQPPQRPQGTKLLMDSWCPCSFLARRTHNAQWSIYIGYFFCRLFKTLNCAFHHGRHSFYTLPRDDFVVVIRIWNQVNLSIFKTTNKYFCWFRWFAQSFDWKFISISLFLQYGRKKEIANLQRYATKCIQFCNIKRTNKKSEEFFPFALCSSAYSSLLQLLRQLGITWWES